MKPLVQGDILAADDYESLRDDYRPRLIEHKNERRLAVGDRVSLVFEDRETLRYQIQEMARVENIRNPDRLQQEIDTYNELMPGDGELSATLFIEIPELSHIREELDKLLGIDEEVFLVLGEDDREETLPAAFDSAQMQEDRISAVHYIRFAFRADQLERFARGERARLAIRHRQYRHEAEIAPPLRASLIRDLRDQTPDLLGPTRTGHRRAAASTPSVTSDRVRVVRPARALDPEHLVVESSDPERRLLDLTPDELDELLRVVDRHARKIHERAGGCRVWLEVDAKGTLCARWHLAMPRP